MESRGFQGEHSGSVLCVDVLEDVVVSGGENGELCQWNIEGKLISKYTESESACTSVLISKVKKDVIYTSFDDKVKVFIRVDFTAPLDTFSYNSDEINQIAVDEKEKYLAASDDMGEIKVIDLSEKKLYKTLKNKHTNICASVCFRPQKPWELFTGGLDSKLIHWDFSRHKCLNMFDMDEMNNPFETADSYMVSPPFVHHVASSPDGKYLVAALENGLIAVFDSARKHLRELFNLHTHTQGVSQVYFLTEDKFVSGGNDCCIALWDLSKSHDHPELALPTNSHVTNGTSNDDDSMPDPLETKTQTMTDTCLTNKIQHTGKINWMKPFYREQWKIIVADESNQLTLKVLDMN
ncbi:WD repeat-containing protein 53-like [Ostrea edulis]|uniref:WD repeat-containing protein 53-like n=1 Tax=Ostrea edulis TaxID=37623 RepID=UPI0024AF2ECC|nr:WD repeat-containing protein 53-like [Ostrea edulis]XP_056004331.1 WD repeat-containing protein 53-like [Ostrea edulis]XP_056004332.1 WD repeat-containing protein 53-like [Ostrea edulis]